MSGRHQRSLKRINIDLTGRTVDGKTVVKGAFKLVNERGIPFDALLAELDRRDMVLDWADFLTQALATDWTIGSFYQRAEQAIYDIFERERAEEMLWRLKLLITRLLSAEKVLQ